MNRTTRSPASSTRPGRLHRSLRPHIRATAARPNAASFPPPCASSSTPPTPPILGPPQYLGIDWGARRANWCAIDEHGTLQEGAVPADQDGLARLALTLDTAEVHGCIEMMSGAVWVRDRLATVGWDVRLADARKVKAIAPLAGKTDRVDAPVLADPARRDLVWVPAGEGARQPGATASPRASNSSEPQRSTGPSGC